MYCKEDVEKLEQVMDMIRSHAEDKDVQKEVKEISFWMSLEEQVVCSSYADYPFITLNDNGSKALHIYEQSLYKKREREWHISDVTEFRFVSVFNHLAAKDDYEKIINRKPLGWVFKETDKGLTIEEGLRMTEKVDYECSLIQKGAILEELQDIETKRLLEELNVEKGSIDAIRNRILLDKYDDEQLNAVHNALKYTHMSVDVVATWDPEIMSGEDMCAKWEEVDRCVRSESYGQHKGLLFDDFPNVYNGTHNPAKQFLH